MKKTLTFQVEIEKLFAELLLEEAGKTDAYMDEILKDMISECFMTWMPPAGKIKVTQIGTIYDQDKRMVPRQLPQNIDTDGAERRDKTFTKTSPK